MTDNEKYYYILGQSDLIKKIQEDLNCILDDINEGRTNQQLDIVLDIINLLYKLKAIEPDG